MPSRHWIPFVLAFFGCSASDNNGHQFGTGGQQGGTGTEPGTGSTGVETFDGSSSADDTTAGLDSGGSSTFGDDGSTIPCGGMCDGVCLAGDLCCPAAQACSDTCCPAGEVCSFGGCLVPGADCTNASDCETGEYCEYTLGDPSMPGGMCNGAPLPTGKCLPDPPQCEAGQEPVVGGEVVCLATCEYLPAAGVFDPEVKYAWSDAHVMMTPIVLQLDDDDCDGSIDDRDIPDIVFSTFPNTDYNNNGTLRAISIVDGVVVQKWNTLVADSSVHPSRSIAGGNIDGLPGNEIVACTEDGSVRAFDAGGQPLWLADDYFGGCQIPTIVDLDHDGTAEILVMGAILDGVTGAVENPIELPSFSLLGADLDEDGTMEIVSGNAVFSPTGALLAQTELTAIRPAAADLDGDGSPEILSVQRSDHTLVVWRYLGPDSIEIVREGLDLNAGAPECSHGEGGGSITIADFNGDGTPDVGTTGGTGYTVFDGASLMDPLVADADTVAWDSPSNDCSSARTGSSVFDFDGDGRAEVLYGDQQYLRVYDGQTGDVLVQACNTNGTVDEYPVVADVDNDGQADIVAVANSYSISSDTTCPLDGSRQKGVRVFGSATGQWVRTRSVWNQHLYYVTNVELDGSIPPTELRNWDQPGLNNFRQNVAVGSQFLAADLVAEVYPKCLPNEYGIVAQVRNIGRAAVPAGVTIGFYAGDPAAGGIKLGTALTTGVLYPGQAETVVFVPPALPPALLAGTVDAFVLVDDGGPPHAWQECRTDNNKASAPAACTPEG